MKRFLLSFVIFNISLSVYAQYWFNEPVVALDTARICVMYQLTYIDDTLHINFKKQEKQILITGYESSSYQSFNHYKFVKTGRQKVQEGKMMEWLQSGISTDDFVYHFKYRIYKKHANGSIITTDYVFLAGAFKYEENRSCFNWDITLETDTINGYFSQKAICDFGGRRWEAWFTPEIPYSDGPYKFCGLPGLILRIADVERHYEFTMISIEIPQSGTMVEYYDRDNYILTTKKEFFKVYDNDIMNITNAVLEKGGDANVAYRASQYAASQNNPLELERK